MRFFKAERIHFHPLLNNVIRFALSVERHIDFVLIKLFFFRLFHLLLCCFVKCRFVIWYMTKNRLHAFNRILPV